MYTETIFGCAERLGVPLTIQETPALLEVMIPELNLYRAAPPEDVRQWLCKSIDKLPAAEFERVLQPIFDAAEEVIFAAEIMARTGELN